MPETRKYQGLPAPTQSDLQKWLREKHRVNVEVNWLPNIGKYRVLYTPMDDKPNKFKSIKEFYKNRFQYFSNINFEVYEHALEYGLLRGLKQIKIKEKIIYNEKNN
jgi:regulator of sigma D